MEPANVNEKTHVLLDTLRETYGYDFSGYSFDHIKRRILNWMIKHRVTSLNDTIEMVTANSLHAHELIREFSILVTSMFRDPDFYLALRRQVVPILKTFPFIKIWHAGCATGEEVYSMAILLHEEGLYDQCRIYATDFNNMALEQGKEGIYRETRMRDYSRNYLEGGGKSSLADYYTGSYGSIIMQKELKKNITWAYHNLVTDKVFNEMNLVICRNVLIYFTKKLQRDVLALFTDSLCNHGVLCLGSKESIRFSAMEHAYQPVNDKMRIYQKKPVTLPA